MNSQTHILKENSGVSDIAQALVGTWSYENNSQYAKVVLKNLVIVIPRTPCYIDLGEHSPFWYDGKLVSENTNRLKLSTTPLFYMNK